MKKKYNLLIWYLFLIIYLEIIYKVFVFGNIFSINSLYIILFSIPVSLILYFLSTLFKPIINKILTYLFTISFSLIFISQFIYFKFYSGIFSFYSLKTGTVQVMGFITQILDVILKNIGGVICLLIPLILFILFNRKVISFLKINFKVRIIVVLFIILIWLLSLVSLIPNKNQMYSTNHLYYGTHTPNLTVSKLGLFTTMRLDAKRSIFGFKEKVWKTKVEQKKEVKKKEYNIVNINFDELIQNEANQTIKEMHEYLKNEEVTQKNDYTGIFKGKNIIHITAEGFDTLAIDKDLTPTLYKMANNSFVFKNFYTPIFNVSTSDGEYMNTTSLIPKEGVWSMYRSYKIRLPYAIGNVFKKEGYTTKAYHNHTYTYYSRDKSHPNLGFDYMGCGNGLEQRMNCKNWPNSDLEMIDATFDDYGSVDAPFATYYMTVSGHLRYNFYNAMAVKNKAAVADLAYSDSIKAYIAQHIELDKAMESLLKKLSDLGKLDDTLIVISPDHYPYGLTVEEMMELSEVNKYDMFDLFKTTLIMYNPKIEKKEINNLVSCLDILPTILNLFGVNYDSRLLMGKDAFSEHENIVILNNRSWKTEKGEYNSLTSTYTPKEGYEYDEEYINRINTLVYNRFLMSTQILDNNYYNYLNL